MAKERPKVGLGSLIVRDGKVLIGKRLAGHGKDTWMIPGGHLEYGESFEEGAIREAMEESGLTDLQAVGIVSINNDIAYDTHYISIGVLLESKTGEPTNPEKGKSSDWHWHDPHELPAPFFSHSEHVIKNWLNKTVYSP